MLKYEELVPLPLSRPARRRPFKTGAHRQQPVCGPGEILCEKLVKTEEAVHGAPMCTDVAH